MSDSRRVLHLYLQRIGQVDEVLHQNCPFVKLQLKIQDPGPIFLQVFLQKEEGKGVHQA